MIGWWVAGGAVLIALMVMGFCAYELLWRVRRLRRDVAALAELAPEVAALQSRLEQVANRVSTIGPSGAAVGSSAAVGSGTVSRSSVLGTR